MEILKYVDEKVTQKEVICDYHEDENNSEISKIELSTV
jgi:hypothetical protein